MMSADLRVLERRQRPRDSIPVEVLRLPLRERLSDLNGVRLTRRTPFGSYYVAPGRPNELCLIRVRGADIGVACTDRQVLRRGAIYLTEDFGRRDKMIVVAGIVPDGVTVASTGRSKAAIDNNVFVLLAEQTTRKVTVSGPAVGSRTIDLGRLEVGR